MPLLGTLRGEYGVGPVCHELDIAPSTTTISIRKNTVSVTDVMTCLSRKYNAYTMKPTASMAFARSGARCTIARLMKRMGLTGVLRGKKVRTTVSRKTGAAHDRVNRQFVAERPDQL